MDSFDYPLGMKIPLSLHLILIIIVHNLFIPILIFRINPYLLLLLLTYYLLKESEFSESQRDKLRPKNQIKYKGQWWMIMEQRKDVVVKSSIDEDGTPNYSKVSDLFELILEPEETEN